MKLKTPKKLVPLSNLLLMYIDILKHELACEVYTGDEVGEVEEKIARLLFSIEILKKKSDGGVIPEGSLKTYIKDIKSVYIKIKENEELLLRYYNKIGKPFDGSRGKEVDVSRLKRILVEATSNMLDSLSFYFHLFIYLSGTECRLGFTKYYGNSYTLKSVCEQDRKEHLV